MMSQNYVHDVTEVLAHLKPVIDGLVKEHLSTRKLWFPVDLLLPGREEMDDKDVAHHESQLRERARAIPSAVRAVFALNALTESGLPSFHRLLAVHLGDGNFWGRWIDLWTAEEDRHDTTLLFYAWLSRVFDMKELWRMRHAYLGRGFRPNWGGSPRVLLAYTTLQEEATRIAHGNTGKALKSAGDSTGARMLGHIAGEEGKHHRVYRTVFGADLAQNPNEALPALWRAIRGFAMPGVSIPGYEDLAYVAMRLGIFTPAHFGNMVRDLVEEWDIERLTGLVGQASEAQERIAKFPKGQTRLQRKLEAAALQELSFPFLPNQLVRV